ncbi:hypothetical protein HSX11_28395 [Oxalobacteraceae bacterium]|nr:hypothetical protein [Oxalobacteraceae bacterium]
MNSKNGNSELPPHHEHNVTVRSLDEHMSSDQSFSSAYARAVGAIAASDGAITLAQFAAVTDIAGEGKASAVFTALVLNAIESGVSVDWALSALAKSAATADQAARDSAFSTSLPLLALHGAQARALALRLAKALGARPHPEAIERLPAPEERGLLANLGEQARKLVKGRSLADAVSDFARGTGQQELVEQARNYQAGQLELQQIRTLVQNAAATINQAITTYQEQARMLQVGEASATSVISAAQELKHQVQQRLTLVDARIAYERSMLVQEIEDAVHDAGNAIELAITDRLNTDKWKEEEVWDSIGRNQFGQEMERRLDRVIRRKEEALNLLQQELRLFQQAMRLSQTSVFQRQHHTALSRLMPRLRLGTRLANSADTAANVTLMGGAVAAAGTGTAAYLFGAAVVLPVLAPAAPFVGGAVLLAGVFKWFADGGKRKRSEIRDKRTAFEEELRRQFEEAELSFHHQLDLVADGFHGSALHLLTPIMLEAEAAGRIQGMRQRVADRVIAQAHSAIRLLEAEISKA